jgi:hypothetical protein
VKARESEPKISRKQFLSAFRRFVRRIQPW